ncbi:MAG: hypothetical protein AAFQ36_05500 [Pseudomonadota bacterium]
MSGRAFQILVFCGAAAAAAPSAADDAADPALVFSLRNSPVAQGTVIEPQLRLNDSFGVRMPIQYGDAQRSFGGLSNGEPTQSTTGSVGLLADYYPFGNGLRLGGGVVANGERFTLPGDTLSSDGIELNGRNYTASIPAQPGVATEAVNPVVTMGFSGGFSRLSLDLDLGLMVTGTRIDDEELGADAALSADQESDPDSFVTGMEAFGLSPFLKFGAKLSF